MTVQPEFSRPVRVDEVPEAGLEVSLTATSDERAALARRFDLIEIGRLEARVVIRPETKGLAAPVWRVRGRLEAAIVQTCVVTLEPVPARLAETFETSYAEVPVAPARRVEADEDEDGEWHDLWQEDPPEPLEHGAIDVGEAVAQYLSLSLDPNPRVPDARFAAPDPETARRPSPFADLARLRKGV